MVPTSSRRSLLAGVAAGAAALAGCAALPFSDRCSAGYTLDVTRLTDSGMIDVVVDEPPEPHADTASDLLDAAVDGDAATYTTYREPPLEDASLVVHGGAYYRVERSIAGTRERTARMIEIEFDRAATPAPDATVVPLSDLPEADREAFRATYPAEKLAAAGHPESFSTGGPHVYPDGADSQLVGSGELYVRYDNHTYRVSAGETRPVEEHTYRYTVTEVAADRDGFLAFVRERFVVPLDDLPKAEAAVFDRATEETVSECEPLSEGFADLVHHLRSIPEERRTGYREWLVARNGRTYRVDLMEFVA